MKRDLLVLWFERVIDIDELLIQMFLIEVLKMMKKKLELDNSYFILSENPGVYVFSY